VVGSNAGYRSSHRGRRDVQFHRKLACLIFSSFGVPRGRRKDSVPAFQAFPQELIARIVLPAPVARIRCRPTPYEAAWSILSSAMPCASSRPDHGSPASGRHRDGRRRASEIRSLAGNRTRGDLHRLLVLRRWKPAWLGQSDPRRLESESGSVRFLNLTHHDSITLDTSSIKRVFEQGFASFPSARCANLEGRPMHTSLSNRW